MSQRRSATAAPGLLEEYRQAFDSLFTKVSQRDGLRRYLEGLLLPAERNKTLTGLGAHFNLLRASSGLRPAGIKRTVQNRSPDSDHVLSAGAGPAHTRAIKTLLKLFDLTFNTA